MLVLIGIGLAAGFITAISPCVLPVLPIVFAGGATGGRRRPFAIVGGLIVSFTAFTLFGVWLLAATRPASGHPAQRRDRACSSSLQPRCSSRGSRRSFSARSATHPQAGRRARRRLPARGEPRPRLRAVRRAGAGGDHRGRRDAGRRSAFDRPHARVRGRRRHPHAARRVLRARGDECAPAACALDPRGRSASSSR